MTNIVCIFAHPDDEAFGPGGTIAKYAKSNNVFIICATRGEQGQNATDEKHLHLASVREKEMLESARILGVKEVFFLDYIDGTISNNLYHDIASKIEAIIKTIRPHVLLTFEPRGVSGHIDHMAMSMITSFVFRNNDFCKKLYYYCLNKKYSPPMQNYFIYFPSGYDEKDITTIIDIANVWETKVASMMAHKSQSKDAQRILGFAQGKPRQEYFILGAHKLKKSLLPETDLLSGID